MRTADGLVRALLALVLVAASTAVPTAAQARPFTDAAGRVVEVPDKVARVLAAGPPASLLLYTLAPGKMVGWVAAPSPEAKPYLLPGVRDLPAYGRLTGRGGTANVEAVLAAKPDLVVDVGAVAPTYASLADRVQAQTGVPYVLLDGGFARTPETYRQLGQLIGTDGEALAAAAQGLTDRVAAAVAGVPEAERPRVYYARGPKGLETGLPGSINVEILEAAGGRNVAEGAGGLAAVSPEQVLAWDPDVILAADAGLRQAFLTDPLWGSLRAVRAGRVYAAPNLPYGWFDAPPGINRLIGLRWLAGLLYPGRLPDDLRAEVQAFYRLFYHVEPDPGQIDALLAQAGGAAAVPGR